MGIEIMFEERFDAAIKQIGSTAFERMMEATQTVRNQVLVTLSGPRTGRTYFVPDTKKTYTASAPGEPPAVATGRLRQTVKTAVRGEGKSIMGFVGTELEYGAELEYGSSRVEARPWLRISFEKAMPDVKGILGSTWF